MKLIQNIAILHLILLLLPISTTAQERVDLLPGEYWWGGQISSAKYMPFMEEHKADLAQNMSNQVQSLLLSNKGRYVWHEEPFSISVGAYQLKVDGPDEGFVIGQAGSTLKEAYEHAVANFFPFSTKVPDPLLFTHPQYGTSMELGSNQSQTDIMDYAQAIIDQGFPPGVLTIHDNWQQDYGVWDFKGDKFPDPKGMVDALHEMGFKVMLWVCPFVSADSESFRELHEGNDFFLKDPMDPDEVKIVKWWNGYSALLDFTKPGAKYWLKGELDNLQNKYGIDGFKLDGGDFSYFDDAISDQMVSTNEQSRLYSEIALSYDLNQSSATWQMGGHPVVQGLGGKEFGWPQLMELIPSITLQGIMGYPYASPDMLGDGDYVSFESDSLDQELLVRAIQAQALMPMMNVSIAPWRLLDEEHLAACQKATKLHAQFGNFILRLAGETAQSGTPIAQSMEYAYPNQGQEFNAGQFMLGPDMIVAPVLEKGQTKKKVWLPDGIWLGHDGKGYMGPRELTVSAPLDILPYFRRAQTKEN